MYIESLDSITPSIVNYLRNRLRSRLTTAYKHFRKSPRVSLIGDYPLIAEIVSQSYLLDRRYSPNQVAGVFKLTSDPELIRCRSNSVLVSKITSEAELESLKTA